MVVALLVAGLLGPVATPDSRCYVLKDMQANVVGLAVLSEQNNYATLFDTRGLRVVTVDWDRFGPLLEGRKVRAEPHSCSGLG